MSCHRYIINQRSIDYAKAVAGCFSFQKGKAIIYLITEACSYLQ